MLLYQAVFSGSTLWIIALASGTKLCYASTCQAVPAVPTSCISAMQYPLYQLRAWYCYKALYDCAWCHNHVISTAIAHGSTTVVR